MMRRMIANRIAITKLMLFIMTIMMIISSFREHNIPNISYNNAILPYLSALMIIIVVITIIRMLPTNVA